MAVWTQSVRTHNLTQAQDPGSYTYDWSNHKCDEIWYVGSGGHKYYPSGLLSPNVHIWYLICMSVLIG